MKENGKLMDPKKDSIDKINLQEYPLYPIREDIYNHSLLEAEIDPENITGLKTPNEPESDESEIEPGSDKLVPNSGLDIPGAELDDQQEEIGSEDEENNYYSLGGDNHNNLEEDNGD